MITQEEIYTNYSEALAQFLEYDNMPRINAHPAAMKMETDRIMQHGYGEREAKLMVLKSISKFKHENN